MKTARLLAASSLSLLAACTQQPTRHSLALDSQEGCPLVMHEGQNVVLTLPSDPTTGYRWQLREAGQPVLRSLGPEVYSNPQEAGLVGVGGQSSWRFKASQAGQGALRLVYQQPWAPEVEPINTFTCKVRVDQ
jgi:inhibitor of cysteine peptidase